jgi:bacterioferritin-associated ferredoxin
MYVCICNAVTERQIRECARDGATSVADLRARLCVGNTCGKCVPHAKTVLREVNGTPASVNPTSFDPAVA